jgi:hypothetical protein
MDYGLLNRKNCPLPEVAFVTVNCVPTMEGTCLEPTQTTGGVKLSVGCKAHPAYGPPRPRLLLFSYAGLD